MKNRAHRDDRTESFVRKSDAQNLHFVADWQRQSRKDIMDDARIAFDQKLNEVTGGDTIKHRKKA